MSTRKPGTAGLITCGAVAALLVGCSSATPSENTDEACAAADSLRTAVTDFRDTLGSAPTTDDVRAAREEVQQAFDDLVSEGEDVSQDVKDALDKAAGELKAAVDEIPDDATLAERAASLKEEAAKVNTARDDYTAELGCG